jgi:hypothetical protein
MTATRIAPNKRTWFGLTVLVLYFVPLLFLPGRIQAAYCYLFFTGLAIALAGIAETRKAWGWLFFACSGFRSIYTVCTPMLLKRCDRMPTSARGWPAHETSRKKDPTSWSSPSRGMPDGFRPFGMGATFKYFTGRNTNVVWINSPEGTKLCEQKRGAILRWHPDRHQLQIQAL